MKKLKWKRYKFELFGLECDIFSDSYAGIMLDPERPDTGYLVQSYGDFVLTISYGPDSSFEDWVRRMYGGEETEVKVLIEKEQTEFCGNPAQRIELQITPPIPPIGYRESKSGGREEIGGGYTLPFRQIIVGAQHRQTPLVAMFKLPVAATEEYEKAVKHFFESFYCESKK